ncbi:MAG: PaaI family thioesterase [Betaproteobacteria bacterium]|nr:PaaI family thioesterase [Betaproteobacteria bacterium]
MSLHHSGSQGLPPPADAQFAERIRTSFARQPAMTTIGATLVRVAPGEVEIQMPFGAHITQQHGFIHGGILGTALDSACGFASLTLMPADAGILTIEYKLNLLAPGRGEWFRFVGRVRKAGRTITLADADAIAVEASGRERLIATMTATEMTITGRDDVRS